MPVARLEAEAYALMCESVEVVDIYTSGTNQPLGDLDQACHIIRILVIVVDAQCISILLFVGMELMC